jgi:hypothetical protein
MSEITVYRFLDIDAAEKLKSILNEHNIAAFIKVTPDDRTSSSYQVYINEGDILKATPIIDRYKKLLRSKQVVEKYTCPRCKAKVPHVEVVRNLSLIKRLLTFGTQVVRCKKCGNEWYI